MMPIRSFAPSSALLAVLVTAACDGTEPPGPPAGMAGLGATTISVTVGTTAADSLRVKVVDADGRAVSNATVAWKADPGSPALTLSPAATNTDGSGIARTSLRAGTVSGTATVRASVITSDVVLSVPFNVTLAPGAPVTLHAPAAETMGTGVSRPVVVARDPHGNATLAGVTLTSSNAAVAEVSAAGVVTSKALGAATITAQAGSASAQTRVWVVPATINACETNTATLCSAWTLADSLYNASWDQGSRAVIRVGHFSADSVRFNRVDPSGTSWGMTAVYRGRVSNRSVPSGVVRWIPLSGSAINGTWTGTW